MKKDLSPGLIAVAIVVAVAVIGGLGWYFTSGAAGIPPSERINPAAYEEGLKGRGPGGGAPPSDQGTTETAGGETAPTGQPAGGQFDPAAPGSGRSMSPEEAASVGDRRGPAGGGQ